MILQLLLWLIAALCCVALVLATVLVLPLLFFKAFVDWKDRILQRWRHGR